jgi:sulfite exporter TauE/SafE
LVLTALIAALASKSAVMGAINMLVFGMATIPSLFAVKWLAGRTQSRAWSRVLASLVMMFFGFQFAMRGFASLGMVGHFMIGSVMFW